MIRTHITDNKTLLCDRQYIQDNEYSKKPNGLWYSIDDQWLEWCNGKPDWIRKYRYTLEIDLSRFIVIDGPFSLGIFLHRFSAYETLTPSLKLSFIEWEKVQENYDGIEIINYFRLRSMPGSIYYPWLLSWDVSGGCVWNLEALRGFKRSKICRKQLWM
jgi:hypothetical protein